MLSALAAAVALLGPAEVLSRLPAPEANQGVAVDGRHIYAVDNSTIGKYDRRTGQRVAIWKGDAATFPHLNSCDVIGRELVCAASNYPKTPMVSSIEIFDRVRMRHLRTIPLGSQPGSLSWVQKRGRDWWAGFANYDGRGGEAGRDHTFTTVVKFDRAWRPLASWRFPGTVLQRFKPRSASGGAFGEDGLLYVTGHDLPEAYVLRATPGRAELDHIATVPIAAEGQAIAFDRSSARVLFGISRAKREIVAMRLPKVEP